MIYGYARVSTVGQGRDGNSLEDQVKALESYGCQEIITEAFTGKTVDRPKFQKLMKRLKEGDTFLSCRAFTKKSPEHGCMFFYLARKGHTPDC